MGGVLEHARAVTERKKMPNSHLRNIASFAPRNNRINCNQFSKPGALARSLKGRNIALGRLRPRHRSAGRVSTLAHGVTAKVVRQQSGDLATHLLGIPKR